MMQLFRCCAAVDKEKALKELEQTFKNAGYVLTCNNVLVAVSSDPILVFIFTRDYVTLTK